MHDSFDEDLKRRTALYIAVGVLLDEIKRSGIHKVITDIENATRFHSEYPLGSYESLLSDIKIIDALKKEGFFKGLEGLEN